MTNPTPEQIKSRRKKIGQQFKAARLKAGHTQEEAGAVIKAARRTWQDWELGNREPNLEMLDLYLIRTKQK